MFCHFLQKLESVVSRNLGLPCTFGQLVTILLVNSYSYEMCVVLVTVPGLFAGSSVWGGKGDQHAKPESRGHRPAHHGERDGDPDIRDNPGDARGVFPVQRVPEHARGGDRTRPHCRANTVHPLQHQPLIPSRPQSVHVYRQTDGEGAGIARLVIGESCFFKPTHRTLLFLSMIILSPICI